MRRRRGFNLEDEKANVWTYELPDGRYLKLPREEVRRHGAAELIRRAGLEPFAPGEENKRLPVYQRGRKIGTVPATFDPELGRSTSVFYDVRPGDFIESEDGWVADPSLGPGDLGALVGFVPEENPESYRPAELTPNEEEAFKDGLAAGMEFYIKRVLGLP